ncbi:hypothetical protein R1sor_025663 [Riccia sorocarpa]|uniref:Reverse transcriptase domain-containing protein n=1 Tax=Riccia sorocarpa TaxID=122646 RepID=A0ABD3GCG5_9MARC
MVELPDDSRGKSALIVGAEARCWKHLTKSKDLVDAYFCVLHRTGATFTRQAFCGNRFDRARLDRFYLSEGAEWLDTIQEVIHHSDHGQVASDHIPITLTCDLLPDTTNGSRPKSYFKMGPKILRRPGVKDKIKRAWESHPPDTGNAQRRWEMAWIRAGVPFGPYLLTFCTQVLMDLMNDGRTRGEIKGLHINGNEDLLQQLFADDMGIYLQLDEEVFTHTMNALETFEMASSARLNLQKTTVIPMFDGPTPHRLTRTGCQVASTEDRFQYLGILHGVDIVDDEIMADIQIRYAQRLKHWSNSLLT